jgi:hypothetical protein
MDQSLRNLLASRFQQSKQLAQQARIAARPQTQKFILEEFLPSLLERVEQQVYPEERIQSQMIPQRQKQNLINVWEKNMDKLKKLIQELEKRNFLLTAQNYADDVLYSNNKYSHLLPNMNMNIELLKQVNDEVNNLVELLLDQQGVDELKEELLGLLLTHVIDPIKGYAIFLPGYQNDKLLSNLKEEIKQLLGNLYPLEQVKFQVEEEEEELPRRRSPKKDILETKKKLREMSESYATSMRSPGRAFELKADKIKKIERKIREINKLLEEYESDDAKKIMVEVADLYKDWLPMVNPVLLKKLKKLINDELGFEKKKYLQLLGL